MKLYGYKAEDSQLISLEEITFQASLDELEKLMAFFKNTIEIIRNNPNTFGHEHFSDYIGIKEKPDIIIVSDE